MDELSSPSARPTHGGNLAWAAALVGCSPSLILDFSASINPLGPPHSAIAALQTALGNLTSYPDPSYTELRLSLSQVHQLPEDWILPGNGSAELLTWAGRELAALPQVYLPTPAFGDYHRALQAFGAKVIRCPLPLETFQSTAGKEGSRLSLAQSLSPGSGLLLNNPHNPTGALFTRDQLRPYFEQLALVVVDEAFMDFLPGQPESVADWVVDYPQLVVLRSLTKFYSLPGLRLGYAIAHPERLQRWQQWRDPWPVNTLAAAAATAVLQDTTFQQQTWDWLKLASHQLFQGLTALPGLHPYPSQANFILVQTDGSVSRLQRQLLERDQILIRDCLSFPELGDRFFRVAVRTESENNRLLQSLAAILSD